MQARPGGCYRVYDAITAAGGQRNFDRVSTAKKKWAPSNYATTSHGVPSESAPCGPINRGVFNCRRERGAVPIPGPSLTVS